MKTSDMKVFLWMQDCVRQPQRNAVLFVNLKKWVIGTFTSVHWFTLSLYNAGFNPITADVWLLNMTLNVTK